MTIIFVDSLAGVKYPEVIAKLPREIGTGYFWEEFGRANGQTKNDLKSGRQFIRIQGLWGGKSHIYTDAHRARSITIAQTLNAIAAAEGRKVYYSPFCEHKLKAAYMLKLLNEIRDSCPNVIPVNSPINGGEWVNGHVNEIHHFDKPAGMPRGEYIFSMDGLHQPDADITKFYRYLDDPNCIAFGVWALQHNCKLNAKDSTLAGDRKCLPTHDLNMSLIFQVRNRKRRVKLAEGHIIKTHSEQHKDVDPRANKLTYIGPKGSRPKSVRVGKMDLVDNGVTPDDGRPVFRSTKWAYRLGRVARVFVDGKSVGTVDRPFRENEWRQKT